MTGQRDLRLPCSGSSVFLIVFVCGVSDRVMLALVPFNWAGGIDTHFVVAHMHYVLRSPALLFPLVAGFYYWVAAFIRRVPFRHAGTLGLLAVLSVGSNMDLSLNAPDRSAGMPRRVYYL